MDEGSGHFTDSEVPRLPPDTGACGRRKWQSLGDWEFF